MNRFKSYYLDLLYLYINMNTMDKLELKKIISGAKSKSDICKKLGYHLNGGGFKKLNKLLTHYNLDITDIFRNAKNVKRKYELVFKKCPVCNTEFETQKNHPREKVTCSRSCSNTYFRSGKNNPNWKDNTYRSTCFLYHDKKCIVCGENKIVDVYHYDENKLNNNPVNLIPLCPTHHTYYHSRYRDEVLPLIESYRSEFIKNNECVV